MIIGTKHMFYQMRCQQSYIIDEGLLSTHAQPIESPEVGSEVVEVDD